MKNVLLLGCNGFIGSHLTNYLKKRDITVVGADSEKRGNEDTIYVDITSFESIFSLINQIRPEIIINTTGIFRTYSSPRVYYDVHCLGSVNLFESVLRIDGYKPKIFVIGSAAEYGLVESSALPVKESHPLWPLEHYGISKVAQSYNALSYSRAGLTICVGRPFNVIGPGLSDSLALSSFAKQIAEIALGRREPDISVGNLESKRDFVDISDLVEAIWRIISQGHRGKVYNICSERCYSMGDLLEKMISLSGTEVKISIDPSRVKTNDVPVIYGDYAEIERDTGWRPSTPIEESIKSMLDYWKRVMV